MKIFKTFFAIVLLALAANSLVAQSANLEANKAVVRKFYETYGMRHDVEGCLPLFDQAFTVTMASAGALNADGFKQIGLMYLKAFPDLKMSVVNLVAEGDMVVAMIRFTGTQQGDLMNIPATRKAVDVLSADFWTVRNGKLVALHGIDDTMTLMQQLGVIPAGK